MLDGIVSGDLLMEDAVHAEKWHQQLFSVCLQCVWLSVGYHTRLRRNASISSDVAERGPDSSAH